MEFETLKLKDFNEEKKAPEIFSPVNELRLFHRKYTDSNEKFIWLTSYHPIFIEIITKTKWGSELIDQNKQ